MLMKFLNDKHQERYDKLLKKDNTCREDKERQALLYVLASNDVLFLRCEELYDFEDRTIRLYKSSEKNQEEVGKACPNFSTTERMLITVAYNLFNAYEEKNMSPANLFTYSQGISFVIMNAIGIRFNLPIVITI